MFYISLYFHYFIEIFLFQKIIQIKIIFHRKYMIFPINNTINIKDNLYV